MKTEYHFIKQFKSCHMRKVLTYLLFIAMLIAANPKQVNALGGSYQSHDPSAIIKDGSKYWMFTTGNGIYAAYSTNLYNWTSGPKTVFPVGTWPSWINSAVPGFNGTFWAPDCIYMNGKYYLYYSCSTFGSSVSAIGVATSPTLDQNSSSYVWTDQGKVVSSSSASDFNAIDPAVFKDADGRLWLSYGSFHGGIGIVELDPATGKVKSGATVTRIAGGGGADWEAPCIVKNGSYYYLFVNRGRCCNGTSSTYYIVMGRSASITGPYVDKNGVDLRNGGGTVAIGTSGKYIGPGHLGLLVENGSNFVSMHYYDRNDNGNAKLDIANMGFSNGWPFVTRDWIASGQYRITNKNSNLVWDAWGCTGASGQGIAQGTWANLACQKWNFTPVGDGYYRITNALGGLTADVINCGTAAGTQMQLYSWLNNNCQKFKLERLADGSHVFTPLSGAGIVSVANSSTTAGTRLTLQDYTDCNCQKWLIATPAAAREVTTPEIVTTGDRFISVYPNPVMNGRFVNIAIESPAIYITTDIFSAVGKLVYSNKQSGSTNLKIPVPKATGVYMLRIRNGSNTMSRKLIVE
jgi:arabinan endo-1,5-alpha-L-arabinosidase